MSNTQVKERPILFSAPMVQAILNGPKTMTRRIIKPQPLYIEWFEHHQEWCAKVAEGEYRLQPCPFGKVGGRIWVRETWWNEVLADHENAAFSDGHLRSRFDSGTGRDFQIPNWEPKHPHWRKRPSIHMPRWASRLTLEIIEVRCERLQDISPEDALAEGVFVWVISFKVVTP